MSLAAPGISDVLFRKMNINSVETSIPEQHLVLEESFCFEIHRPSNEILNYFVRKCFKHLNINIFYIQGGRQSFQITLK